MRPRLVIPVDKTGLHCGGLAIVGGLILDNW